MYRFIGLFVMLFILVFNLEVFSQENHVPVLSYQEFEPLMQHENDTTYVINFWATWCKPCVNELPYFERVHNELQHKKVKVILVSLDDVDLLQSKVKPFISDMRLESDVVLLNDVNYNAWIDKVDASWSGAIPATLIYNKNYRKFFEQSFELEELKSIINQNRIKS